VVGKHVACHNYDCRYLLEYSSYQFIRACSVATCIFQTLGLWRVDGCQSCRCKLSSPPTTCSGNPDIHQHATLLYHEGLLVSERLSGNPELAFCSGDVALPVYPETQRTTPPIHRHQSRSAIFFFAEDINSAPAIRALQKMLGNFFQPSLMCGRCFVVQRALVLGDWSTNGKEPCWAKERWTGGSWTS